MTNPLSSESSTKILGTFASILGLLTIFLYFTAWIYRWAYFSFFSLDLTRLSFPFHSFFFLPMQVFLGDIWAFTKTILALIILATAIKITLWLLQPLNTDVILPLHSSPPTNRVERWQLQGRKLAQQIHQSLPLKILRNLASFIPTTLRKDLVIVIWLLIILYWLARNQGWQDARRDAINDTSTLPVFTYVFPEKQLVLGRKLDDIFLNPALDKYHIIGDLTLFESLRGIETNDTTLSPLRVWRLLLENNNWIYCFPALSSNAAKNEVPPVLAIRQDKEGQLMILSPEY